MTKSLSLTAFKEKIAAEAFESAKFCAALVDQGAAGAKYQAALTALAAAQATLNAANETVKVTGDQYHSAIDLSYEMYAEAEAAAVLAHHKGL